VLVLITLICEVVKLENGEDSYARGDFLYVFLGLLRANDRLKIFIFILLAPLKLKSKNIFLCKKSFS
jgi:hypothetical protein